MKELNELIDEINVEIATKHFYYLLSYDKTSNDEAELLVCLDNPICDGSSLKSDDIVIGNAFPAGYYIIESLNFMKVLFTVRELWDSGHDEPLTSEQLHKRLLQRLFGCELKDIEQSEFNNSKCEAIKANINRNPLYELILYDWYGKDDCLNKRENYYHTLFNVFVFFDMVAKSESYQTKEFIETFYANYCSGIPAKGMIKNHNVFSDFLEYEILDENAEDIFSLDSEYEKLAKALNFNKYYKITSLTDLLFAGMYQLLKRYKRGNYLHILKQCNVCGNFYIGKECECISMYGIENQKYSNTEVEKADEKLRNSYYTKVKNTIARDIDNHRKYKDNEKVSSQMEKFFKSNRDYKSDWKNGDICFLEYLILMEEEFANSNTKEKLENLIEDYKKTSPGKKDMRRIEIINMIDKMEFITKEFDKERMMKIFNA